MGPPSDALKSQTLFRLSGAASPAARASSLLLDWSPLFAPDRNSVPLNWFPPSFGIMLARTPPADTSALIALVW